MSQRCTSCNRAIPYGPEAQCVACERGAETGRQAERLQAERELAEGERAAARRGPTPVPWEPLGGQPHGGEDPDTRPAAERDLEAAGVVERDPDDPGEIHVRPARSRRRD